jgi:hypothetical protein
MEFHSRREEIMQELLQESQAILVWSGGQDLVQSAKQSTYEQIQQERMILYHKVQEIVFQWSQLARSAMQYMGEKTL